MKELSNKELLELYEILKKEGFYGKFQRVS